MRVVIILGAVIGFNGGIFDSNGSVIDLYWGVICPLVLMVIVMILSEKTKPLIDYGFNVGVISFGDAIHGGVMHFIEPLANYGFNWTIIIGGIRSSNYIINR